MLEKLTQSENNEDDHETFDCIELILNIVWKELVRQVSLQCIERGFAMLKVFNAYRTLIDTIEVNF